MVDALHFQVDFGSFGEKFWVFIRDEEFRGDELYLDFLVNKASDIVTIALDVHSSYSLSGDMFNGGNDIFLAAYIFFAVRISPIMSMAHAAKGSFMVKGMTNLGFSG